MDAVVAVVDRNDSKSALYIRSTSNHQCNPPPIIKNTRSSVQQQDAKNEHTTHHVFCQVQLFKGIICAESFSQCHCPPLLYVAPGKGQNLLVVMVMSVIRGKRKDDADK
jgi:hypothetical protein